MAENRYDETEKQQAGQQDPTKEGDGDHIEQASTRSSTRSVGAYHGRSEWGTHMANAAFFFRRRVNGIYGYNAPLIVRGRQATERSWSTVMCSIAGVEIWASTSSTGVLIPCSAASSKSLRANSNVGRAMKRMAAGAFMAGKSCRAHGELGLGIAQHAALAQYDLSPTPASLLVSWRGFEGKDAPEHVMVMGETMPQLLDTMKIRTGPLSEQTMADDLRWWARPL